MKRVKTTRKIVTAMFILAMTASLVLPAYAVTIKNTIANARDYCSTLINDFYDNAKGQNLGIQGSYFEGDTGANAHNDLFWKVNAPTTDDNFAPENVFAMMAFSVRKQVENDGTMVDWARDIESNIFGASGKLKLQTDPQGFLLSTFQGQDTSNPNLKDYRYAIAQFMIMEAQGQYGVTFQDDSVIDSLKTIYNAVYGAGTFIANHTGGNPTDPQDMLVWSSCIEKGTPAFGVTLDPAGRTWDHPLTNVSLWAAIGFARLGIAVRNTITDTADFCTKCGEVQSFGDNCTAIAEASMLYPELKCYNPTFGLYAEDWTDTSDEFQLSTQALAILACSRLYQATQKQFYLDRADSLIASISKYFFMGAVGAGVSTVDLSDPGNAIRSNVINGYSNALLAMALGDLFQVTNNYDYARLCQDIVAFFNTYMWQPTGDVKGYIEFLNATSLRPMIATGYTSNSTKFITTNSMMLYALEIVVQSNKNFWDLYSLWIILGALAIVAIIVVIILVNRRGAVGTKLSKTVRGLITEA